MWKSSGTVCVKQILYFGATVHTQRLERTARQLRFQPDRFAAFYRIGKLREDWGLDLADTDTLSLLNCLFILKDQRNNDPDM
ncbi:hypothetical protein [Holdemania sp. Marseille-P2844]|uniref:hypothetical protein n=1 Tax=Holdemania sp. Marseille-P2844 TaxID=1852366 RepID=UPI000A6C5994|nr:hypothetical protein [Holdemania sp. Marseille-P2844]